MSEPVTIPAGKLWVAPEDPDNAGVYLDPCGLETFSISRTTSLNEDIVYECNPASNDLPWVKRTKSSRSMSLSASGKYAAEQRAKWEAVEAKLESHSFKIIVDLPLAEGGGYWSGNFQLSQWDAESNRQNLATASFSLSNDGPIEWTDAPA